MAELRGRSKTLRRAYRSRTERRHGGLLLCPAVVYCAYLLVEAVVHERLRAGFAAAATVTRGGALAETGLAAVRAGVGVALQCFGRPVI